LTYSLSSAYPYLIALTLAASNTENTNYAPFLSIFWSVALASKTILFLIALAAALSLIELYLIPNLLAFWIRFYYLGMMSGKKH